MNVVIVIVVVVALAAAAFVVFQKRGGYRGAVGFKNRSASEIATLRLTGFSQAIDCRTLAPGEHSFNYLGTLAIPAQVHIAWRLVNDVSDRTATVATNAIPSTAQDGEIFFVLSPDGEWLVEYSPQLRLEALAQ